MYADMEKWCETGMHWITLNKILENPQPPGYSQKELRPKPKIGPYRNQIHEILQADQEYPKITVY